MDISDDEGLVVDRVVYGTVDESSMHDEKNEMSDHHPGLIVKKKKKQTHIIEPAEPMELKDDDIVHVMSDDDFDIDWTGGFDAGYEPDDEKSDDPMFDFVA